MKFKVKTSRKYYQDSIEMKNLECIGFSFKPCKDNYGILGSTNSKSFKIIGSPSIEINSLEELMAFTKKYGKVVMNNITIEIYNYYRE